MLAVASFRNPLPSQQYTADTLNTQVQKYIPTKEDIDRDFPPNLLQMNRLEDPVIKGSDAAYALSTFIFAQDKQIADYGWLQSRWTMLRDYANELWPWLKDQAVNQFRSQNEGRIPGRETIEHYDSLLLWQQKAVGDEKLSLRRCWAQATSFASMAEQSLGRLRNKLLDAAQGQETTRETYDDIISSFRVDESRLSDSYSSSLSACDWPVGPPQLPSRKTFGTSMGPIGSLAGPILKSEYMPVAIVVGLVGFSLLGATVSRVVRQVSKRLARFD
jgi:hypothetical protein